MNPSRTPPLGHATILLVLLALTGGIGALRAQADPMAEAQAAMGAQEWGRAAALFEEVVDENPEHGLAWFRLGMARHADGSWSEAADAYRSALGLGAQVPSATWRLARVLALADQPDSALATLRGLAAAGFNNVALVRDQPDFASLRGVPAFGEVVARLEQNAAPCRSNPMARELDFWIGEWDVFTRGGQQSGTNRIEAILTDCVLLENWTNSGGRSGKSFNFVDATGPQPRWRQLWVDDSGGVTDYADGALEDGAMRFLADWTDAQGVHRIRRMVFTPVHPDTVTQDIQDSTDGGRTWQPNFFGIYVRRGG